ncbi:phosphonate C-P lyase system protein PhnH [Paralimibaculum aggregatum]|uniref:Phosphonate C-P lyase system protein PhnH n=1 Tax=Paralimibaculum aggregatum TaxID=3036245 RepID=A0ABQ6LQI9_9RHOB|nr:phosphonate C-P lyase system protein PhnH [Limibaculum sp. NKW23]GMG83378.1 phosphonate C-P lyase system protein PhnH [Limibaculum sp. NKW23]
MRGETATAAPAAGDALSGGFADPARDGAAAFRAVLSAMAHPGRIERLAGAAPPAGISPAAGALMLALADAETPVWLPERLAGGPVAEWLRFHTNAPAAAGRSAAAFALGRWEELVPLADYPAGCPSYPDRSATLVVDLPALEGGPALTLSGPGLAAPARFAPMLPAEAAAALAENAARFPLGVDVCFAAADRVAALPRSTRLEG